MWIEIIVHVDLGGGKKSHPPCEDVDWNLFATLINRLFKRHPPCEDVDWNLKGIVVQFDLTASSSVWGCGLKFQGIFYNNLLMYVILRVRMWIEIVRVSAARAGIANMSSSVWGCGLKLYSRNSLLLTCLSSSVWGCGLKCIRQIKRSPP